MKPQEPDIREIDDRHAWRDLRRAERQERGDPVPWRGPLIATLWVMLVSLAAAAFGAM